MDNLNSSGIPELKKLLDSKLKDFNTDVVESSSNIKTPDLKELDQFENLNFENNEIDNIGNSLDLKELESLDFDKLIDKLIPKDKFFNDLIPDMDKLIDF